MRAVSRIVLALLLLAAVLDHTKHSADATKPIYDGDKQKGGSPAGVPALLASLKAGTQYSVEVYVKKDNAHAFAKISGAGVELWLDDKIEVAPANSYIMLRQAAALPAAYKTGGFAKVGSAITGLDGADLVTAINFVTTTRVGKAYDLKTNYCGFVVAELLGRAKAAEAPAIALVNQMVDKQVAIPLWNAKWIKAFTAAGVPAAVSELKANLLAAFKGIAPPPGGAGSPPPSSPGGAPPSSRRGSSPPPSSGRASARSRSPSPRAGARGAGASKFLQRLQA